MHNMRHVERMKAVRWSRIHLSDTNINKMYQVVGLKCEMSGQIAKQVNFPSVPRNGSEELRRF